MKSELIPANGDPPIPIVKDVTVVGRREYCDIEIRHESLSKRHAVIVRTDGLLMVRDLASTNGTKVNGQRVMWAALLPNDRLTLGRLKYKVYLGSSEASSPSETHEKGGFARPQPLPVAAVAKVPARPPVMAMPSFPPPTPLGVPVPLPSFTGSTDPDADVAVLDEFLLDEEDEAFEVDVD